MLHLLQIPNIQTINPIVDRIVGVLSYLGTLSLSFYAIFRVIKEVIKGNVEKAKEKSAGETRIAAIQAELEIVRKELDMLLQLFREVLKDGDSKHKGILSIIEEMKRYQDRMQELMRDIIRSK